SPIAQVEDLRIAGAADDELFRAPELLERPLIEAVAGINPHLVDLCRALESEGERGRVHIGALAAPARVCATVENIQRLAAHWVRWLLVIGARLRVADWRCSEG